MKFRVKDIGNVERREVAELPIDGLPLLLDLMPSEGVSFTAPVSVDIRLVRKGGDAVLVTGAIDTQAVMNCSRCLEKTATSIHADIRILFEPRFEEDTAPSSVPLELTSADMERSFYEEEALELLPTIQEEVIAAMPFRLLCRDDCKGLCPQCGVDLNQGPCHCSTTAVDPRLAALKNWQP